MALANRNILRTRSALRSGALTGLAQIVIALAAAGAGALLAHKFGRTAETDGFLGAYGVYLVLVLAALAFLALAVPVSVLVAVFSGPLGDLITGTLPPSSAHVAGRALVVLVPAAF